MRPAHVVCPHCGSVASKVVDSRATKVPGKFVGRRRRRACDTCKKNFATIELNIELYNEVLPTIRNLARYKVLKDSYK